MEKIKLVIWDLDDTFWDGTLSENEVSFIDDNIEIIKELTGRGIINSIISKNKYEDAKKKLEERDLFDWFVFPRISWDPKGQGIKIIIENCQLRAENVLFLDDNHLNLKEAVYYNKGIHSRGPDFIKEILHHPSFVGKNDAAFTRLQQYKLLESRFKDVNQFSNNIEFLKSSEIKITYIDVNEDNIDRLHELLERTNQLNFTKKRLSIKEIHSWLLIKENENKLISVTDKYGDYGIVGFYSFLKKENKLAHFTFSCRILNLGVEQFIYAKLNFPKIEIVPEIAIQLNNKTKPDWIIEVKAEKRKDKTKKQGKNINVLFKGGCDLDQMLFYLNNYNFNLVKELNYVSENNIPIHREHTQILIDSQERSISEIDKIVNSIPFIDKNTYSTKLFDCNYDVLIFSLLMDYTQVLYKEKISEIRIPFGGYYNHLTNTEKKAALIEGFKKRNFKGMDELFLDDFNNRFELINQINGEDFYSNLKYIRNKVPLHIPIIFINGAEVESPINLEQDATKRHIYMNGILDEFIKKNENCHLIDIRKIVTDKIMLTDNIRHYQRDCYYKMAQELIQVIETSASLKIKKNNYEVLKSHCKKIIYRSFLFKKIFHLYKRII